MRTIEEYMKLPYRLEVVPDTAEPGFVASYPELPGCITCGATIAKSYSGQFKLRIPRTMHKTLAENSKKQGASMNEGISKNSLSR